MRMVNSILKEGVHSLLKVKWSLQLDSPLCIRNNRSFEWGMNSGDKTRYNQIKYKWNELRGNGNEISDLNFDIQVKGEKVKPVYSIPANSIRGVLRSWTIRHLITERQKWAWTIFDTVEEPDVKHVIGEIENDHNGYALIAHLFGFSIKNEGSSENWGHKGRIEFQTGPFSKDIVKPKIVGDYDESGTVFGPKNSTRQIKQRGPVDRITHGAKEGGLHTFLEFATGQSFDVIMRIINPKPKDVGLLALWKREINDGMIRFGAVSSIGRGKVTIMPAKEEYYLYAPQSSAEMLKGFQISTSKPTENDDVMGSIWQCYSLNCDSYKTSLQEWLTHKGE